MQMIKSNLDNVTTNLDGINQYSAAPIALAEDTPESEQGHFPSAPEMNASTWVQVKLNMLKLKDISEKLGKIEETIKEHEVNDLKELLEKIFNNIGKVETDLSDVTNKLNQLIKKLEAETGTITNIVVNVDKDTQPIEYKYDYTFEIKRVDVIGLTGKRGFKNLTHCLVQTVKMIKKNEDAKFIPYQIATGTDGGMKQYIRMAKPSGGEGSMLIWDKWKELRYGTHFGVYDSEPAPDEQAPGDFWLQPITPT